MRFTRPAAVLLVLLLCGATQAGVVINEILYHAPNDLDDVQFIELHNTGDEVIGLAGWKLTRGVTYEFAASAKLDANGYLVLCKNLQAFKKAYGFDPAGQFKGALSHSEARLELLDAQGKSIDRVRYRSRAPWPVSPDGYSASLERICPTAPADSVDNWAPSPLPNAYRPSGTPGKRNASYSATRAPAISRVTFTPSHATPGQEIKVDATVSGLNLKSVEVRYRYASSGAETEERSVLMKQGDKNRYSATIPTDKASQIVRFRVAAGDDQGTTRFYPAENDLRPALSVYVHDALPKAAVPLGYVINVGVAQMHASQRGNALGTALGNFFGQPGSSPRGNSAFVYVDAATGTPEVFDFIHVTPRKAGRKVRLHKDHLLAGMSVLNLIYEELDRFVLAEPMAYEVYRKAGNAAPRTDFVRTWLDGQPIGYQLLIEQPNKAFIRHIGLKADGNIYKCVWWGNTIQTTHEKKTHMQEGHQDIVALVNELQKTRGEAQWAVIKKNFDVEQVINYFAVNMVLSHWDGYFNNYFTYHDVSGTGKWTMYPWDQDKTWGFHDGIRGYDVFVDMPLSFGMEGDVPPGMRRGQGAPSGFGFGSIWWRPGGAFSRPLLANPQFRQQFLARTKEILETVYTEDVFFPKIKQLGERLEDEVTYRAELQRQDPKQAVAHLNRNLDALRTHLTKRRNWLLQQDELKKAGAFDRTVLK